MPCVLPLYPLLRPCIIDWGVNIHGQPAYGLPSPGPWTPIPGGLGGLRPGREVLGPQPGLSWTKTWLRTFTRTTRFHPLRRQEAPPRGGGGGGGWILYLSVFCICLLNILSSCFVLQRSAWVSCILSSLSIVCMFTCDLSPSTTRVYVSPFGYFRVSCSFSITSFTPRFQRNSRCYLICISHYLSFSM